MLGNLTMLVAAVFVILIVSRASKIVVVLSLLAGALLLSGFDLTYYTDRLEFSLDTTNTSSVAYLQGWQQMNESLSQSSGWGLGFQQMGLHGSDVDAAELLRQLTGDYMNLTDGSFMLSRFVSDFGIFGIVGVLFYLYFVARSILALRNSSFGRAVLPPGAVLAHSILVMSVIDVFVRGIGYLTGSMILFLSAYLFLYNSTFRKMACQGRSELLSSTRR